MAAITQQVVTASDIREKTISLSLSQAYLDAALTCHNCPNIFIDMVSQLH